MRNKDTYLAHAKILLSTQVPATQAVMHALSLIEAAMPLPGTPEYREAFKQAHERMDATKAREGVA